MIKNELKNLKLYTDKGHHYLSATYRVEDDRSIREFYFPRIYLPVGNNFTITRDMDYGLNHLEVDIGFGNMRLEPAMMTCSGKDVAFTETVIKEKIKEMTLEEIEKKLGHKVKIVNK